MVPKSSRFKAALRVGFAKLLTGRLPNRRICRQRHLDRLWCVWNVLQGDVASVGTKGHRNGSKPKRFSISLADEDYSRLKSIAQTHRPKLTLQYLVNWSIHQLIERTDDPQLYLELGDPLGRRKK